MEGPTTSRMVTLVLPEIPTSPYSLKEFLAKIDHKIGKKQNKRKLKRKV